LPDRKLPKFWSIAQCHSLQERRAVDNLRRIGFEAFSPTLLEHRPGRRSSVLVPTFPGYVFVALERGYPWAAVNTAVGVIKLLTSSSDADYRRPQRVPPDFVHSLRRCLVEDRTGAAVLAQGTRVRALRGVLEGHEAVVRWSAGDRLRLLFSIFNRETEVEFELADVEVLERV
jgi:transcription antitermination factor NusG